MGKAFFYSIVFICGLIAVAEILFRLCYRIMRKRPYQFIPRIPFKKMYIEPHPYLPYVSKKHFLCSENIAARFQLNQDKGYKFTELKTNNFRHYNGPDGSRDIVMPKPEGLTRINCLGASTTGNYIFYNGRQYSYPMELEKILKNSFPGNNTEVNNCGQGGYTSAEVLIKFLLDTIDTTPDIVVLYLAYNDLQPSMTDGFQGDYSHAKRNLGEIYHRYEFISKIPYIPLAIWNYLINARTFGQNIRFTLLSAIARKNANIDNDFEGLGTYERNIEHIINICKANGIQVVLSTFCHYLYDGIKDNKEHLKYHEGIKLENEIMRGLSRRHDVPLVDNDMLIPRDNKYFVDSIHFSPEGMQMLAENISKPIINILKTEKVGSLHGKQA